MSPLDTGSVPNTAMKIRDESIIQDAASWVLRIGVVTSVLVMVAGLVICFIHGTPTVQLMESVRFNDHLLTLFLGMLHGDGLSTIQVGIVLLVLTPIVRVAVSMILFWVADHDLLYTVVTFAVLMLTLSALLFLR